MEPTGRQAPTAPDIALHWSSEGADFVGGLGDLLLRALERVGAQVSHCDERDPFPPAADWHVVLVPDEFFSFGAGARLSYHALPRNLVLINTEARGTPFFSAAERYFPRARMVWDVDYDSAQQIADSGYEAEYLQLPFIENARIGSAVSALPDSYWTKSLPLDVRTRGGPDTRFRDRPIDIFFAGRLTPRRERFFSTHAAFFARAHCFLSFGSAPRTSDNGASAGPGAAVVRGLLQRTKAVLNVHEGERSYFQWHRIVLQGIWNRALVVSEPCGFNPLFVPGEDYVEARPAELTDVLDYHLRSSDGCARAEKIIEHAYATLTTRCDLTTLRLCLARLGEPVRSERA